MQNGHNNIGTNASDVVVENLNQDIGPNLNSERTAGLMFTYDTGDDLTALNLQYLESTYKIVTNTSGYNGIIFGGPVKDGKDGDHHDDSSGGNGDPGENGCNLTLTLGDGATIVCENGNQSGIDAVSDAGKGGHGGGSDTGSGGHGGDGASGGNSAQLTTSGPWSHGIFAQSVGGGGGSSAPLGNPFTPCSSCSAESVIWNATVALGGHTGSGGGKPGAVAVTVTGSVTTTGPNAHGIWAQTAGGSDNGTTTDTMVAVDLSGSGSVLASGASSIGIFAQSVGDGRGPIAIDLESADTFVVGGSTAIYVKDAPSSSISNNGGIAPSDPDNGTAIQAENTSLTVTNNGSIDGNICRDSSCGTTSAPSAAASVTTGQITLINQPSGRITSRDRLEVDHFINHGTLDIGGTGDIRTTTHRGDMEHRETGKLLLDFDASQNRADKLEVDGTADLAGKTVITIVDAGT